MVARDVLVRYANQLEPLPPTCVRLAMLVAADEPDLKQATELVTYDPILTAKILRMANSVLLGSRRAVGTVKEAVVRLGARALFNLSMAASAQPTMEKSVPGYGIPGKRLWRHCLTAALTTEAARDCCTGTVPAFSFTAALLHDIGKLVLGRLMSPEVLLQCGQKVNEGHLEPFQAEREILSVHHGDVGGIVAQSWQLPSGIVNGITYHHSPADNADPNVLMAYLGNAVAHELEGDPAQSEYGKKTLAAAKERLALTGAGWDKLLQGTKARLATVTW
jgi:HD-like signal output (HDOD) protein